MHSAIARFLFGRAFGHTDNFLNNVVDISEIAFAVAVIENLDSFSFDKLVRKAKIHHIWTTGGTVDRKETQSCRWDVIDVGEKLVAFFVAA